jgi:hypothetical protein
MPRGEVKTVGTLLVDAERSLLADLYDRLALAGFSDLPFDAAPLFRHVDPGGSLVADVAALGVRPQVVEDLERLGYARAENGHVHLTERGEACAEAGQRALEQIESSWRDRVGAERFATFLEVLDEL